MIDRIFTYNNIQKLIHIMKGANTIMVVGERKQAKMAQGNYRKNEMYAFAEQFTNIANVVQESAMGAVDVYQDIRRTLNNQYANETLRNYFIEGSYDPDGMDAYEIEEHCESMGALFDNDREGILENTYMSTMNPVIGMTFPMHKWILMNMVFDKGGIPKVVTQSPAFTISQETRYLIDTEGNEIDMFKEQNKMTDAIEATAPLQTFDVTTLPLTEATEIVHDFLGGLAGVDHLSVETNVYAVLVKDVYFAIGDILPNAEGYIEPKGEIATEATTMDVWVKVKAPFTPGYAGQMGKGFDRTLAYRFNWEYKVSDTETAVITDTITGTMKKDRLNVMALEGNVAGIRIQSRIDTSNARATTCSVAWRADTIYEEIPNAIPINVTISPEEVKDINALYNVNQVTKIMHMMKSVLANYKDDKILRNLNDSYSRLDARSSSYGEYDWAPIKGYAGDHIQWRRDTFLDFLDSQVTKLLQALNDPNMTVTIYGDPDLVRKITPTTYSYQTPASIGPVELDFTKTVYTSDRRHYQFIGSDKLRGTTEFILVLCPNGTDRILYRIYDYQMYLSNEIRNADNPALPAIHSFERWKFVEYTPVQGRINILHPNGINQETYNAFPVRVVE